MIIVLDTNVVFSTIIKANGYMAKVFFSVPSFAEYYAPEFFVTELQMHQKKLLKLSGLSPVNYELAKTSVFAQIKFVDINTIPNSFLKTAVTLTRDIDFKDFQFVALTLFLNGILWTGDKKLYNGLRRKGFDKVIATKEISSTFSL
jgi:predicted nucleic acid-binding protein